MQEKPGCAEKVNKRCANTVIRREEEKLIFAVSQCGVLWDATQETYWVLEKKIAEEGNLQQIGLAR